MYFPYDEERQVYPMDDGFMMRKPWDENKIPPEKRAWLYENYHPLFIMRHRMSKQADAILGMYLHSNLFTKEEIKRNYDFYQEVTLHHSSLSTCIFGIVACSIGYLEEGYEYFSQSARMDLDDYHNNFYAGIHAANMAGTWQAIVNGFAGVRCQNSKLTFEPSIPEEWEEYAFRLRFRGTLLEIQISKNEAKFTVIEGTAIQFSVDGKEIYITWRRGNLCGRIIKQFFLDWDGTAVMSRKAPADDAVQAMRPLLQKGVKLAIISGTTIENIAGGKLESCFTKAELENLYLGLGRGAYNYAFRDGKPYIFKNMVPEKEEHFNHSQDLF
mgnify:CR=1 FL=1